MGQRIAKKVLVVGWDAAEWDIIHPLMDRGLMPALEGLINRGTSGKIATLEPPLSPMLWTSIATGKRPYKHGILGFIEPNPEEEGGIRPAMVTSRKVKAVWNMLNQEGIKSHVIGWWPSHPAEPIDGTYISNFYWNVDGKKADFKMTPGTVHPPEKADFYESLRMHTDDVSPAHLLPMIPRLFDVDLKKDNRPKNLAKIIAEAACVHNAATHVLETQDWEFVGVYYNAIDLCGHNFMKYHPPRMEHIDEKSFELYKDVMNSMYRWHDMMLSRLLDLAGEDTTVILLSDHGFHAGDARPRKLPNEPAAPEMEHNPYGVVCLSGPGFRKDELLHSSTLLDITPTILTLFGLPVAKDMDGKVLTGAFEGTVQPTYIDSWEEVPGNDGQHPEGVKAVAPLGDAMIKQLEELGYIEEQPKDEQESVMQAMRENRYFLAKANMDGGRYQQAADLLEGLYKEYPKQFRYSYNLARCLFLQRRYQECETLLAELRSQPENYYRPMLKLMEGRVFLELGQAKKAMRHFKELEKGSLTIAELPNNLGRAYLGMKRYKDALKAFERALKLNSGNPTNYQGIGVCYLHLGQYEKAADAFLQAVGLNFNLPYAHHQLGMCLYHLGLYSDAANAFQVALSQAPGINKARQMLLEIYTKHLPDETLADQYRQELDQYQTETVYVVSGLPRSGTSMMMQMLDAGGLPVFTDQKRTADDNNPKGYYEHQLVRSLARDRSWVRQATGKVVKVIASLLPHLPPGFKYKVIYMDRPFEEVMRSQHEMLVRLGKAKPGVYNTELEERFKEHVQTIQKWLPAQQNIDICYISYADAIESPLETAQNVASFLEMDLDTQAMAAAVDPSLYREKA